jgi:hypothetical protein
MSTVGETAHAAGRLAVTGRSSYSVSVTAHTLSSVLEDAAIGSLLDLMILDLEGHELEALRGLDFDRHAPRYLMVQALDRSAQQVIVGQRLYELVLRGEGRIECASRPGSQHQRAPRLSRSDRRGDQGDIGDLVRAHAPAEALCQNDRYVTRPGDESVCCRGKLRMYRP